MAKHYPIIDARRSVCPRKQDLARYLAKAWHKTPGYAMQIISNIENKNWRSWWTPRHTNIGQKVNDYLAAIGVDKEWIESVDFSHWDKDQYGPLTAESTVQRYAPEDAIASTNTTPPSQLETTTQTEHKATGVIPLPLEIISTEIHMKYGALCMSMAYAIRKDLSVMQPLEDAVNKVLAEQSRQ